MNNKPFLTTTALQDFWDKKSDEVLFLGSWCMLYDKKKDWENLNYEVMESPWRSKGDISKGMEYCTQTYDILIERLAEYLNEINSVNYETRYWELIVGHWFATYLFLVYDHYIYLKHVLERFPNLTTLCLSKDCFITPSHYDDFVSLIPKDFYNLQTFSHLFLLLGYEFPEKNVISPVSNPVNSPINYLWKTKNQILSVERWFQKKMMFRKPILLWDTYIKKNLAYKIMLSTGLKAVPVNYKKTYNCNETILRKDLRNGLIDIQSDDTFQQILLQSLPVQFPVLYLEGYKNAIEEIRKKWKRYPKILMSSIGWYGNDYMKFVAAETIMHGGKLMGLQHGGGYGLSDSFLAEKLEMDLSDHYYSWGWGDENSSDKISNFPNPKLSILRSYKVKSKNSPYVLYISTGMRRYNMRSVGSYIQVPSYLQNQLDFFRNIPEKMQRNFLLRLFPIEYGLLQDKRLLSEYPILKLDDFREPFLKRLRTARLVVFDHLSTPFLEALNYNIPIIVFNGNKFSFYRKEALVFIDMLKEAGIYFDNATDAAAQVRKIYNSPEIWWQQEQIQSARIAFMDRYALGSDDWLKKWRKELLSWL